MRLILFATILAVYGFISTEGNIFNKGKDILGSGVSIATGVAKAIPSYLEPKQIFDLGKQALLGYPVEAVASAINAICEHFFTVND